MSNKSVLAWQPGHDGAEFTGGPQRQEERPDSDWSTIVSNHSEQLARANLTGRQRRILDVIFLRTYGYVDNDKPVDEDGHHQRRIEAQIGMTYFEKATRIDRSNCAKVIKGLLKLNVIQRKYAKEAYVYALNEDVASWDQGLFQPDPSYAKRFKGKQAAPGGEDPAEQTVVMDDHDTVVVHDDIHDKANKDSKEGDGEPSPASAAAVSAAASATTEGRERGQEVASAGVTWEAQATATEGEGAASEESAPVQPDAQIPEGQRKPKGGRPAKPKEPQASPPKEPKPKKERAKTPEDLMFEAICRALGWDYRPVPTTENHAQRGEINQLVRILKSHGYTPEDVDEALAYWQRQDWRWLEKQAYPTETQLRLLVGQAAAAKRVEKNRK